MKVLHITEGFDGGVVTFLRHVLPAQRARGIDVSLVCSPRRGEDQRGDLDHLVRLGVKVHRVPMSRQPRPVRDAVAIASMVGLLRKEAPSVVHTHCFKAGVLGRIAARIVGGAAVVHTPHCFPFMRDESRIVRRLCRAGERHLARWTRCLMLVSESQRQAAIDARIGDLRSCEVIPNGLPVSEHTGEWDEVSLSKQWELPGDALVVGTLCRLVDYKCAEHFVRAAEVVRRQVPKAVFLVIGDGPLRARLVRLAGCLHLGDSIRFVGHRPDADRLLPLMDVCVLCSRAEGMPYVLLEAMRAGVAVVASAVPGNADLIEDGRTGLLYEFGRVDHLADRLIHCLADSTLRARLCHAAKQHVVCHHRLDCQVDAMVRLYHRLGHCADLRAEKPVRDVCLRAPSALGGK